MHIRIMVMDKIIIPKETEREKEREREREKKKSVDEQETAKLIKKPCKCQVKLRGGENNRKRKKRTYQNTRDIHSK